MTDVNLADVDLNLLVVLDAVLQERSATRAAARLHVTQSAVSSALRRLRELFDDPLMVRTKHGFVPTRRAVQLAPALEAVLRDARQLFSPLENEPERSARVFSLAATDAISVVLLPRLLPILRRHLPLARVRLVTLERELASDGLVRGDVDLLIGIPPTLPPGCRGEPVYEDSIVCVARRDHPAIKKRLTLEQFASLPHVEVALFGEPDDRVDRALARVGRTREILLSVPHFSSVPFAVANSDCIAILGRLLAQAYLPLGLRVLPPPLPLAPLAVQQVWHKRAQHDAALSRLRGLVRQCMGSRPL